MKVLRFKNTPLSALVRRLAPMFLLMASAYIGLPLATAFAQVLAPPAVEKEFDPTPIGPGEPTQLTITVTNNNAQAASNLSFTDNLPDGLLIDSVQLNTCGGVLTTNPESTSATLTGGAIPANADCEVILNLLTFAPGSYTNSLAAGAVIFTVGDEDLQSAAPADATLVISNPPEDSKSFSPQQIAAGGISTLTIRIENNNADAATGLTVTDNLPAGLVIAALPNTTNSCGGTLTAVAAGTSITLTGGAIAANSFCTITVDVTAPAGIYPNQIFPGEITFLINESLLIGDGAQAVLAVDNPIPPDVSKVFVPSEVAPTQSSTLTITIANNNSTAATDLELLDNLPPGLLIVAPAAPAVVCGGTLTATIGTSVINLTGGIIAANSSCTFSVNVAGAAEGLYTNTIEVGDVEYVIEQGEPVSNVFPAEALLLIEVLRPEVSKQFVPSPIAPGGVSVLTITVENNNDLAATALTLTDLLPPGLLVAAPAPPAIVCGGALVAPVGGGSISLTGGTIAANSSCTFSVNVTGAAEGIYTNTIEAGATSYVVGETASTTIIDSSANLVIVLVPANPPVVSKQFAAPLIAPGGSSLLTIRVENNNASPATALTVTDMLPTGLTIIGPAGSTTCGGTLLAPIGGTTISLTGGSIPANSFCTISVNVTAAAPGVYTNTINAGQVLFTVGPETLTNTATSATLFVAINPPSPTAPTVAKRFAPERVDDCGTSTLIITLSNPSSTPATLTRPFTDTLPEGLETVGVLTTTCQNGVVRLNQSQLTLVTGTIPANGSCLLIVEVASDCNGVYTNRIPTGALQTNNGINQAPALARVDFCCEENEVARDLCNAIDSIDGDENMSYLE